MSGGQFWGLIFTVLSALPAVYVIAYRVGRTDGEAEGRRQAAKWADR